MTRLLPRWCAALLVSILLLNSGSVLAQRRGDLAPSERPKNNAKILDLFRPVVARAVESTVVVLVDGKQAALGTVVKADGYILTKDSELNNKGSGLLSDNIIVKFKDGKELDAKKVADNDTWDLALLKVDAKNLKPVTWEESKVAPVGNWVATPSAADRPIAVGVVSVASRTMPPGSKLALPKNANNRGYLGIQMEDDENGEGVVITTVMPNTPAAKAGLKKHDLIVAVDGKTTPDRETLGVTIGRHKPGDFVSIRFRREGQEEDIKVKLEKFPFPDRGDFQNNMGTDISERRKGFPITLQHDTDLKSYQCGGPLVDLEQRVIGINIARGGRTDTYAIPAEIVKSLLPELLGKASAPANSALNGLIDKIKVAQTAVTAAEAQKRAADKKLTDARAALEKLLAEQKREKEKK